MKEIFNQYRRKPLRISFINRAAMALFIAQNFNLESRKQMAAQRIIDTVCLCYGLERDIVFSKDIKRGPVEARQVAIYILDTAGFSLREIERLAGMDYSSVSRGIATMRGLLEVDKEIKARVSDIMNEIF